jgi:hypothetical protein
MQWAFDNFPFDTLTIVDSDQLAMRPGYSQYLGARLDTTSGIGVLGNSASRHALGTRAGPAEAALRRHLRMGNKNSFTGASGHPPSLPLTRRAI